MVRNSIDPEWPRRPNSSQTMPSPRWRCGWPSRPISSRFQRHVRPSPPPGERRWASLRASSRNGKRTSRTLVLPAPFRPIRTRRPRWKTNSCSEYCQTPMMPARSGSQRSRSGSGSDGRSAAGARTSANIRLVSEIEGELVAGVGESVHLGAPKTAGDRQGRDPAGNAASDPKRH